MSDSAREKMHVLVVDDDREMRDSLCHLLKKAGWLADSAGNGETAVGAIGRGRYDVVLSDVRMPEMGGLDLLRRVAGSSAPPIVLISAHGDIPMAVEAMANGAYSFLEKPFEPRRLLAVLRHAAEQHRLRLDADRLKARLAHLSDLDRVLVGDSASIRALRDDVLALSDSDAPIMLQGETGTGKELVARALHDLSARAAAPFVAINCAAIPAQSFEETMFGTRAGPNGTMLRADKGTLFLDEIGACPRELQAKLLRVLETREFVPLGADTPVHVDTRIISASNEELNSAVADGRFRSDLYYRLNTIVLSLPTLRDRREDIALLFAHFMHQYAALYEVEAPDATAEDLAALLSHNWPGNVRELRSVAERRILAARRGRGSVAEAIQPDSDVGEVPETLRGSVAAFERQLIASAIRAHKGRMDAVAEALGIGRRTLNEKVVKLGLRKDELL